MRCKPVEMVWIATAITSGATQASRLPIGGGCVAFRCRFLCRHDEVTAWVAEAGPEVLGFALCTPTFLDGIYIRPDLKGQGIGSLLLDVVEATHPDGYELWVFESNAGARRLYQRRGLVEVEHTDGSGNEEKAPDVRMAWRP